MMFLLEDAENKNKWMKGKKKERRNVNGVTLLLLVLTMSVPIDRTFTVQYIFACTFAF